jgi:hypothetical protein
MYHSTKPRTMTISRNPLCLTLFAGLVLGGGAAPAVEPGGPIENPGMKVLVGAEGVQTVGYHFVNRCWKPTPWQAQWIWVVGEHIDRGWFRKEVALPKTPGQAAAWITADTKYRLWVNGRLVSRGPADIGRDFAGGSTGRWFYDCRDLTPFFHEGRNQIAAEVIRGGGVSRGRQGWLFEARIDDLTVKSDTTWRAAAAGDVYGWQAAEFNDSAWRAARQVDDIWSPLVASEIPPLMEARYPVARIEGLDNKHLVGDACFRVVFDRVLSGFPVVKVQGGKGARVTIKAHRQATFTLGGGPQTLEFPLMDEIAPAYTVEVKNAREPLEIVDCGAIFTSQPVEYRGSFRCSDETLNRIWKASRWAVQICLQTHHLDSPNHQEPISDPGDYLIESMVNHYAFAQPWLARQDIRKFAWLLKDEKYVNFHISYSIGWLQMLMDYYDYTGDRSLVEEMAPYVHELLDTYAGWRGKNGIISEAPNYMFMDWVTIGGFGCHHPPAVIGQGYLTAFYYHGMEMASHVAAMLGDTTRVEKYSRLRREIATAFNRELWIPEKGLYRDGKPFQTSAPPGRWLPADKAIETFSPHVNLLAVLYDLAPRENHAGIVRKVLAERPLNTQHWFMHWVFQAIDHAGLFEEYGAPQMRRWQIVPETQSFREMWRGGDLSHGWCSTPLVQMSGRILGVTAAAPGFKTIAVRPQTCDLAWARGSVPTPQGDVKISWALGEGKLFLDVTIPDAAGADVTIPTSRFEVAAVTEDGRQIAPVVHVGPGAHHFEVVGKLKPPVVQPAEDPAIQGTEAGHTAADKDFEPEVVKDDLLHRFLAIMNDHCSHTGGGHDATALVNGTTRNGLGGTETRDDGRTFRGYGQGDWLVFRFTQPCDLAEVRTFAGHHDGRASQEYAVLAAYAAQPQRFVPLATGSKPCAEGASMLRVPVKAQRVAAIRFEFRNGPLGFNVYREVNVLGSPSPKP